MFAVEKLPLVSEHPKVVSEEHVPVSLSASVTLRHKSAVSVVDFDNSLNRSTAFTASGGTVSVWNAPLRTGSQERLTLEEPIEELTITESADHKLSACKLISGGSLMVAGGDQNSLFIWSTHSRSKVAVALDSPCTAIALHPTRLCAFCCCADGDIVCCDLSTASIIGTFKGHSDAATCIAISGSVGPSNACDAILNLVCFRFRDGTRLWSGGMDRSVFYWDLRLDAKVEESTYGHPVTAIACAPSAEYIGVALENSDLSIIEIPSLNTKHVNLPNGGRFTFHKKHHQRGISSLRFAESSRWFVSTGFDGSINFWDIKGRLVSRASEEAPITSCDISADDKHFITGSSDNAATIYEILY